MKTKIWLFLWWVFFLSCGLLVWFWSTPIKAQLQESFDTSTGSNTYEKIETWLDLEADASYQKFLDEKHPFQDSQYEPSDLAPIPSDFTFNAARKFQLRQEAWTQFADMAWHFRSHFKGKKKLSITSAYRSFKHQQQLLKSYCKNKHQCAEPGSSEHQAWLALDLWTNKWKLDKASLERLQENAYKRGFHQTYQKGADIDGKMVEPWHWRYLGVELATELHQKKLSFGERFYSQSGESLTSKL